MADTTLPVLKAVIALLKGIPAISSIVGSKVYTDVPQKTAFPYLVVSCQSQPFAANDFSGQQHAVRVQSFSRSASISQCLQLRALVMDALDRQESALSLESGGLILSQYEGFADAFIEDDGKTWQSVIEFKVTVA